MKAVACPLLLALTLRLAPVAQAQGRTFSVDPKASTVAFTLGGNTHRVEGTFHVETGSIRFDGSAPALSGSVVVAAGSGDSGSKGRDRKMKTEVLDVANYAQVTFAPTSYQGTLAMPGDSTIQVTGVFTLHGTPHDLTVPMQVHIDGADLTARTRFTVPYVSWGLKDPSVFILRVAKEVQIDLTLKGLVASAE